MPPNLILIVLDAARADHFEPYGAPAGSTPTVADLARSGSHVRHAYAAGSWTIPSHAALFTGLLPRDAGLARAPGGTPQSCKPRLEELRGRLLPEVLRRAGYETRAISANGWLTPASGFATGFERFELVDPSRSLSAGSPGARNAAVAMWEGWRARVDDGARAAGALLEGWMREPRRRPFFWFVNLVEAHSPYLPPAPYNDLPALQRIRAAREARRYLNLSMMWRASLGQLELPAGAVERMRRLYASSIRSLDDWIARALEGLQETKLLDETLVIVTADHGENLGENGMLGHAFSLDERLLRVPLVSAGPVTLADDEVLSLAAVPNRLGRALDLDGHPWEEPLPGGVAAAQFDPPTGPDDPRNQTLLDRWRVTDPLGELKERFTTPLTCATDGSKKLLATGERVELIDLEEDPLERRPLPVELPLGAQLSDLSNALEGARRTGRDSPSSGGGGPPEDIDEQVSDLEERMRLLGYL